MDISLIRLLESLIYPPMSLLLLILAGLLLTNRFRRLGRGLAFTGLLLLYVGGLPLTAQLLSRWLEPYPALTLETARTSGAQAIVVLGGGRYAQAPEYGGQDVASASTLRRIRYGAWLHRKTGLPLLVSGGSPLGEPVTEGELMRAALSEEFGTPPRWVEGRSRNTEENARYSAELLGAEGIRRVLLVSDASHLPRAMESFVRAGLAPLAAPTAFSSTGALDLTPKALIPRSYWALNSALHELLGRLWYRLRYG